MENIICFKWVTIKKDCKISNLSLGGNIMKEFSEAMKEFSKTIREFSDAIGELHKIKIYIEAAEDWAESEEGKEKIRSIGREMMELESKFNDIRFKLDNLMHLWKQLQRE